MQPGTVAIGYVFDAEAATSFFLSLHNVLEWDRDTRRRIPRNAVMGQRYHTDGLVVARNSIVERFLKGNCEWLWWLDTDMGFAPDILDKLMSVADPVERPIVGGLCFMQSEYAQDGMGGLRTTPQPTIFDWKDGFGQRYLENRRGYPVNAVVACDGTGSACVLIHRTVFERIKQEQGGPFWYDRIANDSTKRLVSEDLSFCIKAGNHVHVYTAAKTSHLKRQWVSEDDYWDRFLPDTATERTAVIVPVMQRPKNAEPFMRTLRASTGLATAYAVCDPTDTDTQEAWASAGATVLISDRGYTFAQKANYGYLNTTEPFLFLCGDDVHFYPAWLDHAQHVASHENLSLVATMDLGNSGVMAGEHATHPLIRRNYIDQQGASWDGPGVLCHEGYGHWYVDNEWTMVAKQRGQFGVAKGSVVEHLHPLWGKADNDPVYDRGRRSNDADRRLWDRRRNQNFNRVAA